jgi:hypothetical protein
MFGSPFLLGSNGVLCQWRSISHAAFPERDDACPRIDEATVIHNVGTGVLSATSMYDSDPHTGWCGLLAVPHAGF